MDDHSEELKCILCFDLFTKPVTLICGHTFCDDCITASLDRQPKCPLCKHPIIGYGKLKVNISIQKITEKLKEKIKKEAQKIVLEKPDSSNQNINERNSVSDFLSHFPENHTDNSETNQEINENKPTLQNEKTSIQEKETKKKIPEYDNEFINNNPSDISQNPENTAYSLNPNIEKLIGLEIQNSKKTIFFTGVVYDIHVLFPYSLQVLQSLIPHQTIIGFISKNGIIKASYIIKINFVHKLTTKGIFLRAKFQNKIIPITISKVDFSEHFIENDLERKNSTPIILTYITGKIAHFKLPTQINEITFKKIEFIEKQICFFLNKIKTNNPQISEQIIYKFGVDAFRSKLTIDFREDLFLFINVVGAMLTLTYSNKKLISNKCDFEQKINVLYDFCYIAGPGLDPIFFIEYSFNTSGNNYWSHVAFFTAILVFMTSIFFPKLKTWYFAN